MNKNEFFRVNKSKRKKNKDAADEREVQQQQQQMQQREEHAWEAFSAKEKQRGGICRVKVI